MRTNTVQCHLWEDHLSVNVQIECWFPMTWLNCRTFMVYNNTKSPFYICDKCLFCWKYRLLGHFRKFNYDDTKVKMYSTHSVINVAVVTNYSACSSCYVLFCMVKTQKMKITWSMNLTWQFIVPEMEMNDFVTKEFNIMKQPYMNKTLWEFA